MQDPVQTAALIVLAGISLYLAVLACGGVRAATQQARRASRDRDLLRAQVAEILARDRSEPKRAEHSWNGFRKFEIADKQPEADGSICSFYLRPQDRRPLPPFKPGQYLTFRLHLPGDKKPLIRCYSLSDRPNPEHYRVTIKQVPPPNDKPELPPGRASSFFHDRLKVGDVLDVKAPSGHFVLDTSKQTPIVLVAGGVGITPLLSMLNAVVESGSKREIRLFLGVRNSRQHPMKEHLEALSREHENLHLCVCYSQPTKDCVLGRDFNRRGHVSVDLMRWSLPSKGYEFFLCGPPLMMTALYKQLTVWGVPERRIRHEAFGATTVKRLKQPQDPAPSKQEINVTFTKTEISAPWNPEIGSLLDFAEEQGVSIDYGCRAGNCGTCLTAIQSGEVEYLGTPGEMPEKGSCLVCLSVPKSDLKLEA